MIEFFKKMFKPEASGATARERLRLVLLSDHLSLAPDVVESLRRDLIAVISKYVEVDEANCDVTFERQDAQVAMLANIPIRSMKSRPKPPSAPQPPSTPEPPPPNFGNPSPAAIAVAVPPESATTVSTATTEEPAAPAAAPRAAAPGAKPRRRRRRRPANAVMPAPS